MRESSATRCAGAAALPRGYLDSTVGHFTLTNGLRNSVAERPLEPEAGQRDRTELIAGNAPLASVLVTTYHHARHVEGALDSLRRQTSKEFEVIITDDASTDGTADVITAWLVRPG